MGTNDPSDATAIPMGTTVSVSGTDDDLSRVQLLHPIVDLPKPYCEAVGNVVSRWSWIENQLAVIIREGFELDKKEGRVLTAKMSIHERCNVLQIMAEKWTKEPNISAQIVTLIGDVRREIDERNDIVHGIYVHPVGQPDQIGIMRITDRDDRYMPEFSISTPEMIGRFGKRLEKLQQLAQSITTAIKAGKKVRR